MTDQSNIYQGRYPVPDEWVQAHVADEQVAFRYRMSLDDLIECAGIEDMNDYMDSVLSMRHATLTDIAYRIIRQHVEDDNTVLIEATGVLEEL